MKGQTIFFDKPVSVSQVATIAGPKEGEGPLKDYFDYILKDDIFKQKSYEHAEIEMQRRVIKQLLNKSCLTDGEIDLVFAGDLLDEIIGCNFALREFDIPFFGLYNACATFGEALILGASMLQNELAERVICSTTSHFATAERQYRFPLELGNQRSPLAQWTVTGAGGCILDKKEERGVKITAGTIGKVVDYGVNDANDMGAVMLPATLETLDAHFRDTGRKPDYYDMIVTGDLGHAGGRLLLSMIKEKGYDLDKNYTDCGILVYNREAQGVGQGGSGAGCSSLVFCSYLYKLMQRGLKRKILLIPTGALLSKTSSLQGETIPAIAHAVSLEVL